MRHLLIAGLAAALLAACQTNAVETAETPDPRQGEEVSQVCFNSQIRNWRELDRDSVLIERSVRDVYRLELLGTCQPSNAFTSIGLISRGASSCLSRGDTLVTDDEFDGSCTIRRIYKWNEAAAAAPPAS